MIKRLIAFFCVFVLILSFVPSCFAVEEESGIVDAERLNTWIDDFVTQYHLNDGYRKFSVGFYYTGTGDSWYYNADEFMYSASLYKVPVSMLMAEREAAGELSQESSVMGTTLQYLEATALINSNNYSGHAMVDYLGGTYAGKCADQSIKYTDLPEDYFISDFYDLSYYTARFMTQVMVTLYRGGEESFPHVTEYLLQATPGEYYRTLLGDLQIAQKYGSYEEGNGNKNEHCTAIIYTPNPIIVTVMSRNIGEYQKRIAEVGAYLAAYAQELDSLLPGYLAGEQTQDHDPDSESIPVTEELTVDGQELPTVLPAKQEGTAATDITEAVQPEEAKTDSMPADEKTDSGHTMSLLLKAGLAGVLLLVLLFLLALLYRKRAREMRAAERQKKTASDYRPRH